MKYILIVFIIAMSVNASMSDYNITKNMSSHDKKKRFISIVLPVVDKIHNELLDQYNNALDDIKNYKNLHKIQRLKKEYSAKNDKELLMALKPHPKSIVLAQAAIESAWATSRFFHEANNIFGVWSVNKNEKRISALQKRGNKIVWLKKFDTIEDSIRAYYKLLAKSSAYKEFRELKMKTDDVYLLEQKLNNYCELGAEYCSRLENIIRYNGFTKYD